ncbi:MAG: O-antigen ligase family protein [Candidatus Aquicultor sp.]|nr:O-antigen ligase family protein [Candidatus Aquicultor sp.]
MSELVAARPKALPYVYIIVAIAAVLFGLVGALLPFSKFILIIAGAVVAAFALANTTFAIVLLVMAVPLVGFRVNLGPVPIDAVTICTALVIISYAIHNLGTRDRRPSVPYAWAFLAFLVFSAISAVVAPSTVDSAAVIIRFIGYFALVYAVGYSVKSREALTWILVLMIVAGAITGLYGIYQYAYAPQTAKIGLYDLTDEVAARVGSTFENPNFYAEYLVLMVPLGLALVLGSRGLFRRFVMGGATLLLFAALILTYTRGSWMATGIGVILMSLLTNAWLVWVWIGLFAVAFTATPGVASRLASITNITGGTAGFRMKLWRIAAGIIGEHMWIGIGIGNYYDVFTEYIFRHPELSVGWVIYGAHNSYLTFWAETGIFGILSFVAIILISIKYSLYLSRAKAKDKYLSWINSAIVAGVIGFAINSLTSNSFHHPQGAVFFWLLLGLQVAIDGMGPEPARPGVSPYAEGSVILRNLNRAKTALSAAYQAHVINRVFLFSGRLWQKSGLMIWLFKKPATPSLAGGSRFYAPVERMAQVFRRWGEATLTAKFAAEVVDRPFVASLLFVGIALAVWALSGLAVG